MSPVLRFAEELMMLLVDRENGNLVPVPDRSLRSALAGATLADLAFENRVDTDLENLVLVDPTPVGDDLLDPALEAIAAVRAPQDTAYWIEHFAQPKVADRMRDRTLDRLVVRRILEKEEGDWLLSPIVARTRRYPTVDGDAASEIELRVMSVLFADDVPSPRDAMLISLVNACGLFSRLLSRQEHDKVRDRIDLVRRLELIGRSVEQAIRRAGVPDPDELQEDEGVSSAREQRARALARQPLADGGGLPVLGNLFHLVSGNLLSFIVEQYQQLGPVFRVRAPFRSFTVMAGPEANLFLQRQGRLHLRSLKTFGPLVEALGAHRTIVSMDGGDHFRWRKAVSGGFSHKVVLDNLDAAVHVVARAVDGWPEREPFSALSAVRRIVIEQITELGAGEAATEYVDDLVSYFDPIIATYVTRRRPKILLRTPRFRRSRTRIERWTETVLDAHRGGCPAGRKPDHIDDLLQLHRTDPQLLPEKDLRAACLGLFVAGLHTVANTAAFMLHEVLNHPDVYARMRLEADELFGGEGPTPEKLRKMDVTPRVVTETLRRYPIASAALREAVNTFEFAGHTIPFGTELLIATSVPHMCHEHFPHPERFDIDRYLPERNEHRAPGVFAPFGLGTHRCLGSRFAQFQLAIIAATLLHRVDVALHPPDFKLKVRYAPLLTPGNAFKISIVRRLR